MLIHSPRFFAVGYNQKHGLPLSQYTLMNQENWPVVADKPGWVWEITGWYFIFTFISYSFILFDAKGRHANAKAHVALDHLARLCQVERRFHNRESNRQPLPAGWIQDFKKNYRSFYRNLDNTSNWYRKKNQKMSTWCNRLDLETLGCQPIMPKILRGH